MEGIDTEFHVTGFKKFRGVENNPSEWLVKSLPNYLGDSKCLASGCQLASCTALETAGIGGLPKLFSLLRSVEKHDRKTKRTIWIHLGVNTCATRFAIERQAFNEATFRCPDELGWEPIEEPIDAGDGSIKNIRKTNLPVQDLVKNLSSEFEVEVSNDAGRFVCNYVYYQSLKLAQTETGAKCLFVHIPTFDVIDQETQLRFLVSLFKNIKKCL